jgi:methylmalonyl-CoA epimerase
MYEIDHVAIAVEDLDPAVEDFVGPAGTEHVWTTESEQWQYRTAYMLAGEDMYTLIEPISEESFMADYLEQRGPGIHHLGVNVEDLEATVSAVTAAGAEVIMENDVSGVRTEATIHPKSWHGVQLQFIEWYPEVGSTPRDHIEAMRAEKEGY